MGFRSERFNGMNDIAIEPDFEYFLGVLYTGYCGSCGRMLFTGGATAAQLRGGLKSCRWCGVPVKITDDLPDRVERKV